MFLLGNVRNVKQKETKWLFGWFFVVWGFFFHVNHTCNPVQKWPWGGLKKFRCVAKIWSISAKKWRVFAGYCLPYQKGSFQGISLAAFINLPLPEPADRKMSDSWALAPFPFSYSGQGCPQPAGENVRELANLKHFVTGRRTRKVNP